MFSSKFINQSKPTILILLLLPSFIWIGMFLNGSLGINPIDILMDKLGEMSLRLLITVMIVSSLSQYIFLDYFFNCSFIIKDVIKRPFITFGFLGFLFLLPLVFTSTNKMIKKVTFKVWKKIHYLIYLVLILGILHFYLLTKGNKTEPLIYLGIVFFLFAIRIYNKIFTHRAVQR